MAVLSMASTQRVLAAVLAVLVGIACATVPAHAEEPATITIGIDASQPFSPAFLPVLSFGASVSLQAQSTSGQPVVFTTEGGCSLVPITGTPGGVSTAVLTATSTADACRLTAATEAGNGLAASTSTYVLRTRLGQQSSVLPTLTRKVAPGTSVQLGAAGLATDRGQPIDVRVSNGGKYCTVSVKKGQVTLAFGGKQGQCTVSASAPGIQNQYLPYRRIYVFKVTRGGASKPSDSKPSQSASVTSATVA